MAISKAQSKAVHKYIASHYDRVEFRTAKGMKSVIKKHAESRGESLNQFLVRAVEEAMRRDGE